MGFEAALCGPRRAFQADVHPTSHIPVPALVPTLPIADAFRPEYPAYNRFLPLELTDGILRIAACAEQNPVRSTTSAEAAASS